MSVSDTGATTADSTIFSFPADADRRIERLNGVIHGGVVFPLSAGQAGVSTSNNSGGAQIQISISGASPGYLAAIDPTLQSGTLYSSFAEQNKLQVAVLGAGAARQLGIHSTSALTTIFIVGTPYAVVGIIGAEQRAPGALNEIFLPISTARAAFGDPSVSTPASMLIETELGAAPIVSQQAALALRPDNPALLHSVPPPNTFSLSKSVSGSLTTLFLILAFVTLFIGAVGITNTTLVAVMERTPEIGLRRAIGARPIDIAAQIVMETAAVGSLGGLVGTSIGVMIVLFTAIAQSWTALINPALTVAAPIIGAVIGIVAGIYPAFRASRIQPIEALRK